MTNRELTIKINTKAIWIGSGSTILSPHSVTHMTVFVAIWVCIQDYVPYIISYIVSYSCPISPLMSVQVVNLPVEVKKSSQIISIVWQAIFYFVVWISMSLQNFIDKIPACRLWNPFSSMKTTIYDLGFRLLTKIMVHGHQQNWWRVEANLPI